MNQMTSNQSLETEEDGLKRINYPSIDAGSSTVHQLMRQYGFESSSNDDSDDNNSDSSEQESSNNSKLSETEIEIEEEKGDNYTVTLSAEPTIETSTMHAPSSFPDLSYNQFQTIPTRRASTSITNTNTNTINWSLAVFGGLLQLLFFFCCGSFFTSF
eukprot:714752_1